MIKAIIFDLDGVLIDATHWHYEALNKALGLFGFTITEEEHRSFYNGLPTRKKLEHLTKEKQLPQHLHGFISRMKQKYTLEFIERHCVPDFQKMLMLKKLKEKGYRLALCSNSIRSSIETMLRNGQLRQYFEVVLSNEDVKHPKPDPEVYLEAFKRLDLKPAECVIVEDADHGIKAATASGAFVLAVEGYTDVDYERVRDYLSVVQAKLQEDVC
jgi:HAD superfamily hydrolase (TIGR01509 family)